MTNQDPMFLDLKFLNAVNTLASAKIDALANINQAFGGDWERAWRSDLAKYIPRDRDQNGKLIEVDHQKLKTKINPDRDWLRLRELGIELITIHDEAYPKVLTHIPHPPFVLYIRGSKEVLKSNCFAVVGTRALTDYGRRAAPHITTDIARAGFTIVSGLAAGIDTLAHKAALDVGGKTIAVLGSGSDDYALFPQQNLRLARKIMESGGAVITEYAPGTHGSAFTFPQRNRIISGLSKGVLVVEADIKSGALITAKYAVDQNRDLFCVPGHIFSKTSQGTNFMIQKGAKLAACAQDILEEYSIYLNKERIEIKGDNPVEEKIILALGSEPMTPDEIIRKTGLEVSEVNVALVMMELNRKVKNLGGNKFVLYS